MEEKKKLDLTDIEKFRQQIISRKISDLELLNKARFGIDDYDFDSIKVIKECG